MAWKKLSPALTNNYLGGFAYNSTEELTEAGNGKWFILPKRVKSCAIGLIITGGSGKVQFTQALESVVKADTVPAGEIFDWPKGVITASDQDRLLDRVTAIRQVNVTGTTKIQITARGN
jgi:hypothetical protein